MSVSDEAFREEYKPLYVPAHYLTEDSDQNKVIYALAQLGEASIAEVAGMLSTLDNPTSENDFLDKSAFILSHLYDKGLIGAEDTGGTLKYNLRKITEANEGAVDPDLLAPGLD